MIAAGDQILAADFISSSAGTGSANKVPKLDSNGLLDASFVPGLGFGSGADGTVTLDGSTAHTGFSSLSGGNYTLTRDLFASNLTINSGVTLYTNGYRVFVANTIAGAGTVSWGTPNVGAAGAETVGAGNTVGGAGGAQSGSGPLKNTAGVKGADGNGSASPSAGTTGTANSHCLGSAAGSGGNGNGGNGGGGSVGGAAGTLTAPVQGFPNFRFLVLMMLDLTVPSTFAQLTDQPGGGGGGAGGQGGGSGSGGSGGGSGASGGTIFICARIWTGTFSIVGLGAVGGKGGDGASPTNGAGGGGAGGNGANFIQIFSESSWTGTITLTGGAGGTFGANGTGTATAGATGATGTTYSINMARLM